MKKIEEIESRIKDLLKEVESLKKQEPKFEVGKWYKDPNGCFMVNCQNPNIPYNNGSFGFGFGAISSEWHDKGLGKDRCLIPATPKEVETALIAEAKKRGFKGRKVKTLDRGDNGIAWGDSLEYDSKNDSLYGDSGGTGIIYKQGQWAEIIKEDKIMIGGYEVEKIDKGGIKIGCKKMSIENIMTIKNFMDKYRFTKISFDGIETDLETINKILAKL
jgi:hypothetical protein